ncbi:hypothetical protein N5D52_12825 [Pseudomonas sp. GD03860]|uniref:hypothetical protein n=1 Tax=Pseudomonas TaxID=286 RepID=UPI00236409FE|nr:MULTISPECIES: hypothetical protein [Pseudomonas]MDD2060597.1 hypothetical protein [Pseudomonas putida]MDH0637827.1 hypothetical protein [Pseudomonas sp. GD03860]
MFKQWSEMLRLYKSSRPKYWRAILKNPLALHLLPSWLAVLGLVTSLLYRESLGLLALTVCLCMFTWALLLAREFFVGHYFRDYYERHTIIDQPFLQRDNYLHYAHFLDALERTGIEAGQVSRMAEFGKVAAPPYIPLNLMQNTLFVWMMTSASALAVEWVKGTSLWGFSKGDLVMALAMYLTLLLWMVLSTISEFRQRRGRLARYLEWAIHDLGQP